MSSPPSEVELPGFESESDDKKKRRDISDFERTFEANVAAPDEILDGVLDDVGDLSN